MPRFVAHDTWVCREPIDLLFILPSEHDDLVALDLQWLVAHVAREKTDRPLITFEKMTADSSWMIHETVFSRLLRKQLG